MHSAKCGLHWYQIWQVFGPWAGTYGANGQMKMTFHNYKSRQFHRMWNREHQSSSFRNMLSAIFHLPFRLPVCHLQCHFTIICRSSMIIPPPAKRSEEWKACGYLQPSFYIVWTQALHTLHQWISTFHQIVLLYANSLWNDILKYILGTISVIILTKSSRRNISIKTIITKIMHYFPWALTWLSRCDISLWMISQEAIYDALRQCGNDFQHCIMAS